MTTNNHLLEEIKLYFNNRDAEQGAAIFAKEETITTLVPLSNISDKLITSFEIDFDELNNIVEEKEKDNLHLAGIIHSHVYDGPGPSKEDVKFFRNFIKDNPDLSDIYFPIISLRNDSFEMKWYQMQSNKKG